MPIIGKILLTLCLTLSLAFPTALAAASENQTTGIFIQDNAQVIKPAIKQYLNTLGQEVETKTQTKLLVVTTKKRSSATIEADAQALFKELKLDDRNSAKICLLLVAIDDHSFCFQLSPDLDTKIPDQLLKKITNAVLLPAFKRDLYTTGILETYNLLSKKLAKSSNVTLSSYKKAEQVQQDTTTKLELLETIIPIFVVIVFGCYLIHRYLIKPLIKARQNGKK